MRSRRFPWLLLLALPGLGLLLACTWLPLLAAPPEAAAQSFVIGSDPVDGSTINSAPRVIRIFFNEEISPASIAHISFAPDGQLMDGGRSVVPSSNPRELDTPLLPSARLPQGSYIVRWTALSRVDGRATHGVIGFNIGHSSLGLPGEVILGPSTSNILPQLDTLGILVVAWDWLAMVALVFWLGILVGEGLVLARGQKEDDLPLLALRKQSVPVQRLCLLALLCGEIINLLLRATTFTQFQGNDGVHLATVIQVLLGTNYGYLWLARVILVAAALGLLWWTTREQATTASAGVSRRAARATGTRHFNKPRQQAALRASTTSRQESARDATPSPPGETREDITAARQEKETAPVVGAAPPGQGTSALPRWQAITWLILAGLILLTLALSGNAAAQAQPQPNTIVLNWIFLVAQGISLGSVAYLALVLLPHLPAGESRQYGKSLVTVLQRYTPVLIGATGVALLSGLFLGETALSNAHQLLADPYGRALLVRGGLALLLLIPVAYALYYLLPRLARQVALLPVVNAGLPARRVRQSALEKTRRRLKRALAIAACLGAAVLLCASLMSFFAPPIVFPNVHYSQNPGSPAAPPAAQTKTAGNLLVTLQVAPARVDEANTVTVTLKDSSGRPVTDAKVQLSTNMEIMDMGTASKSISGGKPAYVATFASGEAFDMEGVWDIFVRVERPGQQPLQVQFQVTVT
ncbi:MAG TPA: copper resistance protein CopC [Ktedonobacteraceae bacterium]|nr:copper resistance protein CopC [Ktedonobacteraceae bacterium]